jgi:predicted short-subunit dehydrogenase-like oxidoreductase (DUF2520 family)
MAGTLISSPAGAPPGTAAEPPRVPRLTLIGAGHVGRALGRVFSAGGVFVLQDVLTRSPASAQQAVAFIGAGRALTDYAQLRPAEVYLLAVSDDQIGPACAALATSTDLRGAIVCHCSGALSSAALVPAAAAGALVASAHPIRSFADPAAVAAGFAGTWCGIEGDGGALAVLEPALLRAGARPVRLDPAAKTVYHAAAVFASNYLVTLLDTALRAYQAAGIGEADARALLRPLVDETVANVFRLGPAVALSGPIARGDTATVARQQDAVSAWDPAAGQLYRALTGPTTVLAARKRRAAADSTDAMDDSSPENNQK